MATLSATGISLTPVSERSYAYSNQASITGTPGTGDIWRFFVIPAGTEIHSIRVQNATLGTGAPGGVGYLPVDGSSGSATAFLTAFKFEVPHASTTDGTKALDSDTLIFERLLASPVRVEKDSFLAITFGTINTGAEGACTIAINGRLLGPK